MKDTFHCVFPRGWHGSTQKPCTCGEATVTKYQRRFSGPLLEPIDINIEVPNVDYEYLSGECLKESYAAIRQRYLKNGSLDIVHNSDMLVGKIRQYCEL